MGKATGFLDYERAAPGECDIQERLGNWNEFTETMDAETLREQAARCMDCGTPYCHAGRVLSGLAAGCPLNNLIPEWNDMVFRGDWRGALNRLHKRNNFPEFTGRVCPSPCEGSCTGGLIGSPVAIKSLEKAIVERGFEEGWIVPTPPTARTGRKVAVVGSGPAGLACAAQLNKAGHTVTVYERADRIGGLLTYGIPNMKLDKRIVQRRVDLLEAEGITFVTGTEIGRDLPAWQLRAHHDALVLCGGASTPRELAVEGRELRGIYQAMSFLTLSTQSLLDGRTGTPATPKSASAAGQPDSQAHRDLSAAGRDVVVIGGGDTGTDCVATALRQGCRSAVQLEILPEPPSARQPNNPWPEAPRVKKTDYGQREAAAVQGRDPRRYVTSATRFLTETGERVCGVQTVRVDWRPGPDGRVLPHEIPGSEETFPAQLVLLALGFTGPEQGLLRQLELESDERSNIRTGAVGRVWASRGEAAARSAVPVRPGSAPPSSPAGLDGSRLDAEAFAYATNAEGVFAAGDMRRGQSLVAWAIREGREAAREVDRYLTGGSGLQ
ncbi:glutamate synthase subunit beta [Saccharibacillus qingshengii]|uniref:glutamate synthase subunit beta n=1 Tax=Saccharibacillus qingshengii TaxID=1763540 RepID=UPI001FEC0EB0|nr:glutamate synthase subunit beta [Saccharibacillus qingshengii]